MTVIKRDGHEVTFDKNKIYNAIMKAAKSRYKETDEKVKECAHKIADDIEKMNKTLSVEEIQDIVEKKLMSSSYKDIAKEYINYRYLRAMARSQYKELMDNVAEKLMAKNVQNQNANVDEYSFGGRMGEANDVVTKHYALKYLVSPMAKENHENNRIYIHDLSAYAVGMHNCLSVPFDDLLKDGFNTRQTDVRPANSINTAFQLVAVLFQIQSLNQFGGVSATHLDWTMVPYVKKSFYKHFIDGLKYTENIENPKELKNYSNSEEFWNYYKNIEDDNMKKNHLKAHKYAIDMTIKETYQAVEGMYHNLNTLQSRSGNQLPFTSINYGTCTSPEGRLVTKALIECSLKGVGKLHKTSIFPCGIFQYMKSVNDKPGTPNYDLKRLALKSTAQRIYPNYANVDWSGNAGYDINDPKTYFSTMGKRKLSSCKILMNFAKRCV